jgi:methylated-DNA-protein-cysteine methyltransferase-like protein
LAPPVALPPNAKPWPDGHEPTEFEQAVIEAVAALRAGEVATYGELAEEIGRPGGGQAVANVLRAVPGLPWWRIIPAEGRLYRTHAPTQAPLLAAEGHGIDEHRRVHPNAVVVGDVAPGTTVVGSPARPVRP